MMVFPYTIGFGFGFVLGIILIYKYIKAVLCYPFIEREQEAYRGNWDQARSACPDPITFTVAQMELTGK